jgi:hypothetical protein
MCDNAENLAGAETDVRRSSNALGPRKNLHGHASNGGVYIMSVHLIGECLIGVYLMSVHLIRMQLIGVYFTGVHLIGVCLISWACVS